MAARGAQVRGGPLDLGASSCGRVIVPGEDGYHDAQLGFNRMFPDGHPAVVVMARGTSDVLSAVRYAVDNGLPVAVRATGHGPARGYDGSLLINTYHMAGVRIDPQARTAWVEAGTPWGKVIHEAAAFGLAPLNGASPGVGVVSYCMGGGLGHLGRSYGYGADHVRSLDVITADGRFRKVTPENEPDLFWAIRGGKGNFGVVTAVEVALFPVPRLYGGGLFLPGDLADKATHTWREWVETIPGTMQSALAFIRFPDIPVLPEPIRGRFLTHIRIAYRGPADEGARLVAPLRDIGPAVLDTVGDMPYTRVADINLDPGEPGVYYERSARLTELGDAAAERLLDFVGEAAERPRPGIELRHLGGALARPPAHPNAVPYRTETAFSLFSGAGPLAPQERADAGDFQDRLVNGMAAWRVGGPFLSFISSLENTVGHVRSAYDPATYQRLVRIKDVYDPANTFRVNHNIPPTGCGVS